jgi:hypothetical protein
MSENYVLKRDGVTYNVFYKSIQVLTDGHGSAMVSFGRDIDNYVDVANLHRLVQIGMALKSEQLRELLT